jgi:hypothetical protein
MSGLLAAALTAILSEGVRQALTASARCTRARRAGAATIYRVTPAGRFVFDAAIVIMGGLACLVVYHGDDWRIAALLGGFTLLCVLAYPGDVVIDPATGIRTRRWYGRPVAIAWHEVADVRSVDQIGQTTVVGVSGRKIVHTSLHADGAGFCRDVARGARRQN